MPFQPDQVTRFHLRGTDIDLEAGTVWLQYAFDDDVEVLTERIDFGPRRADGADPQLDDGFRRVVRLLHLAAGVSYYKAAAPDTIVVETGPLSPVEAQFVLDLYDKGLREFAWHNGLPLPRRLRLETTTRLDRDPDAWAAAPPPGIGIPVGGGKDSAVVVEALRGQRPVLLSVNGHPAAHRVAAAAGLDLAVVRRTLDPRLLQLNAEGARNGHVPVTAIVSLIAVAAGYRLGYDTTVMALERSADEPTRTTVDDGDIVEVNHQWSKSTEFERSLAAVLADAVGPGVHYRSVLRDADELAIAACFASLPQYHRAFVSCNRAFAENGPGDGWCGACPKCRFVFLALATAMAPADLVTIFGADLLADPRQVDGFRDLFEEGRKPFECVGTRHESLVAMVRLADQPAWADHVVVRALSPIARAQAPAEPPDRADAQAAAAGSWEGRAGRHEASPGSPAVLLEGVRRAVLAPTGS